jgi:hypothetical protein
MIICYWIYTYKFFGRRSENEAIRVFKARFNNKVNDCRSVIRII